MNADPARRLPWLHIVGLTAMVGVLLVPWFRSLWASRPPSGPAVYGVRVGTKWELYRGEFCPPVGGTFRIVSGRTGVSSWQPAERRPGVPTEVVFERTDDAIGAIRASFDSPEAAWTFARGMGLPTTARRTDTPLLDSPSVLARVVPGTTTSTALVLVDPGCPGHVDLVRALRTEPTPDLP